MVIRCARQTPSCRNRLHGVFCVALMVWLSMIIHHTNGLEEQLIAGPEVQNRQSCSYHEFRTNAPAVVPMLPPEPRLKNVEQRCLDGDTNPSQVSVKSHGMSKKSAKDSLNAPMLHGSDRSARLQTGNSLSGGEAVWVPDLQTGHDLSGGEAVCVPKSRTKFILAAGDETPAADEPVELTDEEIDKHPVQTRRETAVPLVLRGDSHHWRLFTTTAPGHALRAALEITDRATEIVATTVNDSYLTTSSNVTGASSTPTCEASGSAASVLPEALFVAPADGLMYRKSEDFVADISPHAKTKFEFDLSHLVSMAPFPNNSATVRCGLWFSFPACSQLPIGYPCYQFSGMEQETIQHSGIRVGIAEESGPLTSWKAFGLVQIWPGDNTLVGTFDCMEARAQPGQMGYARPVSWVARSVNGFALKFLQASHPGGYDNGVGMFVVLCR